MLTVLPWRPGTEVLVAATPPVVPSATMARVEEIWLAEKSRRGDALFNGRLFSIVTTEPGRIIGWLAEYKWFLAQRRDPSLDADLRVRPLAVTGLLACGGGIVFGQRAGHVEQDAGLWELVPAGGVDGSTVRPDGSIDVVEHVMAELVEEIGITAAKIDAPAEPFVMIHDAETRVSNLGIILRTRLSKANVLATFAALRSQEYSALEIVPSRQLPAFLKNRGRAIARGSAALLEQANPGLSGA